MFHTIHRQSALWIAVITHAYYTNSVQFFFIELVPFLFSFHFLSSALVYIKLTGWSTRFRTIAIKTIITIFVFYLVQFVISMRLQLNEPYEDETIRTQNVRCYWNWPFCTIHAICMQCKTTKRWITIGSSQWTAPLITSIQTKRYWLFTHCSFNMKNIVFFQFMQIEVMRAA